MEDEWLISCHFLCHFRSNEKIMFPTAIMCIFINIDASDSNASVEDLIRWISSAQDVGMYDLLAQIKTWQER
jgi:tRNA threonylcarbamoyladenosine modification (KEOPS) complex  Pcc1 subunit